MEKPKKNDVPEVNRRDFIKGLFVGGATMGSLVQLAHEGSEHETPTGNAEAHPRPDYQKYREVHFRTAPQSLERQETPLDITTYVDDLKDLIVTSGEDLRSGKIEAWTAIHKKTNAFLQSVTQSQGIKNPLPAIDAVAMHEAVVHAMRRYPDNDLLIGVLEYIWRQISSVVIQREFGVVPPIVKRQESEA